jgi:uncharacterized OB-fold protein
MSQGHANTIPMVDYLALEPEGTAHLVANRCTSCNALFFDRRNACASCGAREFESAALSTTGWLRSFTIVYRAAPNVPAPYVSAIVELDGGGVIKSNLVGVPPKAEAITLGGPVTLVTYGVGVDDDDTEAMAFGFSPQTSNGDLS